MTTQPVLHATDLAKHYGRFVAVQNIDLQIMPGTIHSVIGPNGAGKTTLFHVLTGTVAATRGQILFQGQNITRLPDYRRVQQGMARSFQVTSLFAGLSVRENIRLATQGTKPGQAFNMWEGIQGRLGQHDWIDHILAQIDLRHMHHVAAGMLAHGQQRRLEVGMALAARPTIIFLDEPTSGMGIDDIDQMKALIHGLKQQFTIVLIEHNMGIVMDISDTITVMQNGRVLVEGPPDSIRHDERVKQAYLGNMVTGGAQHATG